MKRFIIILFLLAPLIFSAQIGGTLKVEVVSKGILRTPIDSAKITIVVSGRDSLIGYSDSTGHCRIKPVTSGVYELTVEKQGFSTVIFRGIIVSENKTTYLEGANDVELSPLETKPISPIKKKTSETLNISVQPVSGLRTRHHLIKQPRKFFEAVLLSGKRKFLLYIPERTHIQKIFPVSEICEYL